MEHILACPSCNASNRFGEQVCRFCGHDLAHKCTRCHVEIDPGMAYCPYCGEISPAWSVVKNPANDEPSKDPDLVLT